MSFYPSLPERHHLSQLWKRFPRGLQPLLALNDAFLRETDSELEIGERELIAAHVSALNGCEYCYYSHIRYAGAFGIDEDVFGEMEIDISHDSLRPAMTAALLYAGKLTDAPRSIEQRDYDSLVAAGWSEDAINDIVNVTALYGYMNRLLEGSGMKENIPSPSFDAGNARNSRYSDMLKVVQGG